MKVILTHLLRFGERIALNKKVQDYFLGFFVWIEFSVKLSYNKAIRC